MASFDSLTSPVPSPKKISASNNSNNNNTVTRTSSSDGRNPTDILETAQTQLDMMQDLLSLELALQLVHVNKDSERRVQRFIDIGFPGRMKQNM